MKPFYQIAGVSKQAHQQYINRQADSSDRTAYYIGLMAQARALHPRIGLAKIYYLFEPAGIGRQAFENLGKAAGYALEPRPVLTWKGYRSIPYTNLLSDHLFNGADQIWVTDITYYKIGEKYFYISMIMDFYLRKIIAANVAESLHASHSIALLRQALKARQITPCQGLIHHSDKGSRYTSGAYTELLKKYKIGISMCTSVFENTSMERLNGIIKNDYLIHCSPSTFNQLKKQLKLAVTNYNNCPHGQLNMMSPNKYECHLENIPLSQRTLMK
ncbi:MAG: DDE-type integrase/transposase/recombinase, partial [Bacteroidota bacterium]